MTLGKNQLAPDFTLPSTSGVDFTLSVEQKNKPCILYFYPKDFTPGCTVESCQFRDSFDYFKGMEIDVFGISTDSIASHLSFKEKHKLQFELLSDKNGIVSKLYHAYIPLLRISKRITYLLNESHHIQTSYRNMFGAHKHLSEIVKVIRNQ